MVEMWLDDGLCRLLVDTGASYITLLPEVVTGLRLRPLPETGQLAAPRLQGPAEVVLYEVRETEVAGLFRHNLDVAELDLEWLRAAGLHGFLGMNWFGTFPRVCLDLLTPALELHLTS